MSWNFFIRYVFFRFALPVFVITNELQTLVVDQQIVLLGISIARFRPGIMSRAIVALNDPETRLAIPCVGLTWCLDPSRMDIQIFWSKASFIRGLFV